eukprot:66106_1
MSDSNLHRRRWSTADASWMHWNQSLLYLHRCTFCSLWIVMHIVAPIVLLSYCWNFIDCVNFTEYKIYLIANPFIYLLWFLIYAQMIDFCCGPSPLRRYSKCLFTLHSFLSNWMFTIGLWSIYGMYIAVKMIVIALSQSDGCKHSDNTIYLIFGYLSIVLGHLILIYVAIKEQCKHFCFIYRSQSLAVPWNRDYQWNNGYNPPQLPNYHVHEPSVPEEHHVNVNENQPSYAFNPELYRETEHVFQTSNLSKQSSGPNATKYEFFGSDTFESYFRGISMHLNTNDDEECTICMDDMHRNDQMVILVCTHKFHEKCIVEWLKIDENCPNCRTNCRKENVSLSNVLTS